MLRRIVQVVLLLSLPLPLPLLLGACALSAVQVETDSPGQAAATAVPAEPVNVFTESVQWVDPEWVGQGTHDVFGGEYPITLENKTEIMVDLALLRSFFEPHLGSLTMPLTLVIEEGMGLAYNPGGGYLVLENGGQPALTVTGEDVVTVVIATDWAGYTGQITLQPGCNVGDLTVSTMTALSLELAAEALTHGVHRASSTGESASVCEKAEMMGLLYGAFIGGRSLFSY